MEYQHQAVVERIFFFEWGGVVDVSEEGEEKNVCDGMGNKQLVDINRTVTTQRNYDNVQ